VDWGAQGRADFGTSAKSHYNGGVEFHLRDYRESDVETLWRIDQECFAEGIAYSLPEMQAYLAQPGAFALVAEASAGGEIRGFIIGQIIAGRRASKPLGYVITIDVRASARECGLGSKLMKAAEERMRIAGRRKVVLEVAVNNAAAIRFYGRHGYKKTGTHAAYYTDGTDANEMEKAL